jgi:streptogramin lyase
VGVGLCWPTGIAAGPGGVVWVADHGNGALRRIGPAGESSTSLRLAGLRWPVSVVLLTDGTLVVTGAALYDVHAPEACLMVVRGTQ